MVKRMWGKKGFLSCDVMRKRRKLEVINIRSGKNYSVENQR